VGEIIFGLEAAVTAALFVTLTIAIQAHIPRHGRWLIKIPWIALAMLPVVVLLSLWRLAKATLLPIAAFEGAAWTHRAVFVMIAAIVAGCVLMVAPPIAIKIKHRHKTSKPAQVTGMATWRLDRLALAFVVALALTSMTFWNLDLGVRQEMANLRLKAATIALSVSPARIADSRNAALLYRRAWGILDDQNGTDKKWDNTLAEWLYPDDGPFKPDNEQMLAFLGKQGPVIELLRKAGRMPGCNFGDQYNPPSGAMALPSLVKINGLSRLLCLSSRVAAHQGRMVQAVKDLNASLALADHVAGEPGVLASLRSFAAQSRAFDTFQYLLSHAALTSDGLGAIHINECVSFNAAFNRSVRMGTALGISACTLSVPSAALLVQPNPEIQNYFSSIEAIAPYRVFLWRKDMATYLGQMRRYEQLSARPYYEHVHEWRELTQKSEDSSMIDLGLRAMLVRQYATCRACRQG